MGMGKSRHFHKARVLRRINEMMIRSLSSLSLNSIPRIGVNQSTKMGIGKRAVPGKFHGKSFEVSCDGVRRIGLRPAFTLEIKKRDLPSDKLAHRQHKLGENGSLSEPKTPKLVRAALPRDTNSAHGEAFARTPSVAKVWPPESIAWSVPPLEPHPASPGTPFRWEG